MTDNEKAIINQTFNELTIITPSKKNWYFQIFGTVFMGGWVIGFLYFASEVFFSNVNGSGTNGVWIFLFAVWTIVGVRLAIELLWGYCGEEKLVIGRDGVFFEKTVFGIGKKKRFDILEIKNLRIEPGNDDWYTYWFCSTYLPFWRVRAGKIKFDYGRKTYSFGQFVVFLRQYDA